MTLTRHAFSCMVLFLAVAAAVQEPAPGKKAEAPTWLASLADGYVQAQRRGQPILVRVGSESCVWCRKLEKELEQPALQPELTKWVLVALDAGRLGTDGRALAVGAVPALRLLTPTGRLVASRDGYLSAERLADWLKQNHEKAAVPVADELIGDETPTLAVVERLVALLQHREPSLREAALRRLLPHPVLAAPAVVEAFAGANLQTRLAALELLRAWRAPAGELDPWQPESVTNERLQALQKWAASVKPVEPPPLTPQQLTGIRLDLVRLAQAPPAEALAIRERLARFGAPLVPEVQARLKDAATDQARARLTALRYRLLASSTLVFGWPGGLDRLAATAAAERQQAAQELLARATPAEEALLLDLFASPDPQLREIGVRGLLKIAGQEATTALGRLLADPEPSVRALVLKQMLERPVPAFVGPLDEYVARETDTDLVVHAVRVLRAIEGNTGIASLKKLLKHENWRVRAEAAEGLGQFLSHTGPSLSAQGREAICNPLVELLQDEDAFVVGRAVKALKRAGLPSYIGPLVQTAKAHPAVAIDVIDAITAGPELRLRAIPHLRQLCAHEHAPVRATAIKELCLTTVEVESELRSLLKDPDAAVRASAANAFLGLLDSLRSDYPNVADVESAAELDRILNKDRAGKGRPKWLAGLVELLLPLLAAKAPEERVGPGVALVALGREDVALPALLGAVRAAPPLLSGCAAALAWLPWEQRQVFYRQLLQLGPGPTELAACARHLVRVRDPRALPVLWELTGRPEVTPELAGHLVRYLRFVHFGTLGPEDRQIPAALRRQASAQARPRALAGPEFQRLIALAVLASAAADEARSLAATIVDDDQAPTELRGDAFQLLLLLRSRPERVALAIGALKHPVSAVRLRTVTYLSSALDWTSQYLRRGAVELDIDGFQTHGIESGLWTPAAPRGLEPGMVRPLLDDVDPQIQARAGYLLVLLQEPAGLEPLLRHWRERTRDDEAWARLVYRAVAALGDDARVPILEEICRLFEAGTYREVSNFYWTIRGMDGPNVLRLRKQMRQEFGMDRLR